MHPRLGDRDRTNHKPVPIKTNILFDAQHFMGYTNRHMLISEIDIPLLKTDMLIMQMLIIQERYGEIQRSSNE